MKFVTPPPKLIGRQFRMRLALRLMYLASKLRRRWSTKTCRIFLKPGRLRVMASGVRSIKRTRWQGRLIALLDGFAALIYRMEI